MRQWRTTVAHKRAGVIYCAPIALSSRRLAIMYERLSLTNNTLIAGYAENIQRVEFALDWCRGKRVLDAGCGSGYGAYFLASNGAAAVLGIDVSRDAIGEATRTYRRENLHFQIRDLESIDDAALSGKFDVIVNFETLPHLADPDKFIRGMKSALVAGGIYVVSTPNGELVETDEGGKPLYRYQHKAYSPSEFTSFLSAHFAEVSLYGHWLTHQGKLRKLRDRQLFAQLCEAYYNPCARIGRVLKRALGKKSEGPPTFSAEADSYSGDYAIAALSAGAFGWPPTTLIAVCKT